MIGKFTRLCSEFRSFDFKRFLTFVENKSPTVITVGLFTVCVVVVDFYFVVVEDDFFYKRANELSRFFLDWLFNFNSYRLFFLTYNPLFCYAHESPLRGRIYRLFSIFC